MIVAALFMSVALSLVGLFCVLSSKEIQGYALKHSAKAWLDTSSLDWMNTATYRLYLRLLGAVVFAVGIVATVILAIKWFKLWFI